MDVRESLAKGELNVKPAVGGKRALTAAGRRGAEDSWNVKYAACRHPRHQNQVPVCDEKNSSVLQAMRFKIEKYANTPENSRFMCSISD